MASAQTQQRQMTTTQPQQQQQQQLGPWWYNDPLMGTDPFFNNWSLFNNPAGMNMALMNTFNREAPLTLGACDISETKVGSEEEEEQRERSSVCAYVSQLITCRTANSDHLACQHYIGHVSVRVSICMCVCVSVCLCPCVCVCVCVCVFVSHW